MPLAIVSYASYLSGRIQLLNSNREKTSHLVQILGFLHIFTVHDHFHFVLKPKILRYVSIILSCDKTAGKIYIKNTKET